MQTSNYALANLLNDRDLSAIFQKYIFQCYWCKKVTQRGKGVGIPLWSNGMWHNDYVSVCFICRVGVSFYDSDEDALDNEDVILTAYRR
jgi:hypothetical protein